MRHLVWLVLTPFALGAQQMQRDVLAGHVTGPSGPIAGANVSVLAVGAAVGTFPSTARTDAEGRWLVAIQEGAGEYTVRATAIGMKPNQVVAKRGEPRKPILVDIKLDAAVVSLDAIRVIESRRPRPQRELVANDRAGSDRPVDSFSGAVAVGDQGNLAAMASSIPGVTLIPDAGGGIPGFSVLGLSPDQNRVTLNGLSFGGGDIPRDAMVTTRVATTSYDVSRGGFSGGQLSVTAPPGGNFTTRMAHVTFDAPSLQATDIVGRQLGAQYTNAQVSGMITGPIKLNRMFYSLSLQTGRRSSDLQSFVTSDPVVLPRAGVVADSVTRIISALSTKGLPLSAPSVPRDRLTDNASVLGRFDYMPSPDRIGNLLISARHNRAGASFTGATAAPGHGGELTTNGADATLTVSAFTPQSFLNDLRVSARINQRMATPYLDLPDVRVLVRSVLDDGTGGNTTLQFGGNPALPTAIQTWGTQAYDMLSWFSLDRRHRFRATIDLRHDAFSQQQYSNQRGTYTFNSIADVDANRPASFTRVFAARRAAASALSGSFSLGDDWRRGERSQFMYGIRLDANHFNTRPGRNAAIEARFGARTDFAPRVIDISPRFGFFRAFGSNGTSGIPGFGAPFGTVRGGIGLFRNDVAPTLVAPAMLANGLRDGVRQIGCIGTAVPTPDWGAFVQSASSIPTQCADTAASSAFATTRPNVWMIDERFAAQSAWRANLALNLFLVPKLVRFTVEGVYSLNLHQQAPVDLNFSPVAQFALANEGQRPVFVAPSSIVPTAGAMTNRDSRVDRDYGIVSSLRTNLRSQTRQLIFTVFPAPGDVLGRFTQWQAAYAYQNTREQSVGFSGTTGASPLEREMTRGSLDARHQITMSFSTRIGELFSLATTARVASGTPFTPIVNGDINGDGFANDRAFVFGTTGDSAVRSGMSALLSSASTRVRACLERQMARVATRNSCEGPWAATMNAQLTVNPERLGMQNRMQLSLALTNVAAGVDALLHRSSQLQGWGQSSISDPTLLLVRGFDPATKDFRYDVNQRFGDTRIGRTGIRNPFLVTLEARVQLGRDFQRQSMDQALRPGRTRPGEKLTAPQLKAALVGVVYNPVRQLLQAKDSLSMLTNEQLKALTALDKRVSVTEDSIVAPVATYLAQLPTNYNEPEALKRVLEMSAKLFDVVVDGMKQARIIFTPEQINEFPPLLRASFDIRRLMAAKPTAGFPVDY